MTELIFHTDKPVPYFDKSLGAGIMLTADFTVRADTDDGHFKDTVPLYAAMALNDIFSEYSRTVPYSELSGRYDEISAAVSEKLTEKMNCPCKASLTALTPDERSAKFLENAALMEKMKDPAFAAAEMERALQKARETAEKNGISMPDIQNMKMPDLPPLPDTDDPIARANAIMERQKMLDQMAKNGISAQVAPAAQAAPAAARPKFCTNCGKPLPAAGNFCPECGSRI